MWYENHLKLIKHFMTSRPKGLRQQSKLTHTNSFDEGPLEGTSWIVLGSCYKTFDASFFRRGWHAPTRWYQNPYPWQVIVPPFEILNKVHARIEMLFEGNSQNIYNYYNNLNSFFKLPSSSWIFHTYYHVFFWLQSPHFLFYPELNSW